MVKPYIHHGEAFNGLVGEIDASGAWHGHTSYRFGTTFMNKHTPPIELAHFMGPDPGPLLPRWFCNTFWGVGHARLSNQQPYCCKTPDPEQPGG